MYKANSATTRITQATIPTPKAGVKPWMGKRNPVRLVSARQSRQCHACVAGPPKIVPDIAVPIDKALDEFKQQACHSRHPTRSRRDLFSDWMTQPDRMAQSTLGS